MAFVCFCCCCLSLLSLLFMWYFQKNIFWLPWLKLLSHFGQLSSLYVFLLQLPFWLPASSRTPLRGYLVSCGSGTGNWSQDSNEKPRTGASISTLGPQLAALTGKIYQVWPCWRNRPLEVAFKEFKDLKNPTISNYSFLSASWLWLKMWAPSFCSINPNKLFCKLLWSCCFSVSREK